MSKRKRKNNYKRNYNHKKKRSKSFEEMLEDFLVESDRKQKELKIRYNRQANGRKVRDKNKDKR